jgi:hypothetical protein
MLRVKDSSNDSTFDHSVETSSEISPPSRAWTSRNFLIGQFERESKIFRWDHRRA